MATPQTPAQRKAAERARRAAAGLVRVEVWVHPDDAARVRELAARLERQRLRLHPDPDRG